MPMLTKYKDFGMDFKTMLRFLLGLAGCLHFLFELVILTPFYEMMCNKKELLSFLKSALR